MFYEKTTLANGLTIISEHIDSVRSITLGAWFRVGSRDECPEEAGISHFMEHMMFKGTPTRSAADISMQFDALGAELNAFTSKEYTCYYARFADEHFDDAIGILSDMLLHSEFSQECIDLEREVVIEEIARYEDTPDDHIYDVFSDALNPTHAVGRPVLGTRDIVGGFRHEDCLSYRDRHYDATNCVIVAAGNIEHATLVARCMELFSAMPSRTLNVREPFAETERLFCSYVTKETEQAHLIYGFPGLALCDEDRYADTLLNAALGGGMSSRLFQEVREKRGLAYSVYASNTPYQGVGQFGVYAGTRPDNLEAVVRIIHDELGKLVTEGIDTTELERVREFIIGNLILNAESTRSHMTRLGRNIITDVPLLSLDEVIACYRAVTLDDVMRVAQRIYTQAPTLAVISPYASEVLETRFAYLQEGSLS